MAQWQRSPRIVLAVFVVAFAVAAAWLIKRGADRSISTRSMRTIVKNAGDVKSPAGAPEVVAPTLLRVVMLPLSDRTTVVAEFSGQPPQAEEVDAGEGHVTVEAGPVQTGVQPRDLPASSKFPHIGGVTVRELERPDGERFVSLTIARRGASDHHVRIAGTRVYIDFMPAVKVEPPPPEPAASPVLLAKAGKPAPASPAKPAAAAKPAATGTGTPSRVELPTSTAVLDSPPIVPAPVDTAVTIPAGVDADVAYRDLETSMMQRGRALAERPDVKGLLKLRADLERRDKQLGQQRPADVDRILSQVLRLTDQARVAQLERDRQAFLKEKK